ncbi:hypothetical protein CEP54_016030 [Fusarium duplospermum]|uniref:4-hydroxyphenylpyruvate dioxygenase n=1 Tax=Fusarium duplospermum TaxID=1325734 RepID=A0A428NJ76_9HYPO|nr:hypothetical protein CEP54_016030 [Fusarium duplospermum]
MPQSFTDSRILPNPPSYCRHGHPDLEKAKKFFADFGLILALEKDDKIYFRGFGIDQFCYVAEKTSDGKRKLRATLGSCSPLPSWRRQPSCRAQRRSMTLTHRAEETWSLSKTDLLGEKVTLIYGQEDRVPEPRERPDRDLPPKAHKLGHYGYEVNVDKIHEVFGWYVKTFNRKRADTLFQPRRNKTVMKLIPLDKGKEDVEHHSILIAGSPELKEGIKAHHTSSKVDDVDSGVLGHHYLRKGYMDVVRAGRHVLDSHIFDYCFDSSRFIVEHCVDSDLVNKDSPHADEPAVAATVSGWGRPDDSCLQIPP